jgi:hypothetical protein
MVRQSGGRNIEFALDLANHHSIGVRSKERPQNASARLGAEGGEHFRVSRRSGQHRPQPSAATGLLSRPAQ